MRSHCSSVSTDIRELTPEVCSVPHPQVWRHALAGGTRPTASHPAVAHIPIALYITVFLVGCGFAPGPALQTRLMDVAADAQTLAAASNHSAFNIANALGAWMGGLVISWGWGFAATGYVGAFLSLLGLGVFMISVVLERKGVR